MDYPLSQLRKYHELSAAFVADLGKRIRRIEAARNNTILLKGDICRNLYLIEKGMLACYDVEGPKKYCSWLMTAGDFVTAVDSFNNQVISTETIVAVTECVLWVITREDFEELTRLYREFQVIRQVLTDKYHIQSRVMDAKRKRPPEQFYEYLEANYPAIVREAPITTLASLMGITRTTLYEIIHRKRS
ncbi:cyclic nucleotide-binding domain-containing protein [Puia sp.]|uniref:Crp/Fnr family transcriptional regulator n=1 Tax=Puia sp. TaxID=2045100 RepID=UPI002F403450